MIIVRVIFVETTFPVKIRPRIETFPVNGHFLSIHQIQTVQYFEGEKAQTDICAGDSVRGGFET